MFQGEPIRRLKNVMHGQNKFLGVERIAHPLFNQVLRVFTENYKWKDGKQITYSHAFYFHVIT
jgi:hypothetical protein